MMSLTLTFIWNRLPRPNKHWSPAESFVPLSLNSHLHERMVGLRGFNENKTVPIGLVRLATQRT